MKKLLAMAAIAFATSESAEIYDCRFLGVNEDEITKVVEGINNRYGRDSLASIMAQITVINTYLQKKYCTMDTMHIKNNSLHSTMDCSVPIPRSFGLCVEIKED